MITPPQAQAIYNHMARLCRDVVFYTPPPGDRDYMLFVDLVEKDKDSEWPFIDKSKIDAEVYIYTLQPDPGGQIRIHARGISDKKKGSIYQVIEVIDRTADGFGYVASLEELI